MEPPPIAAVKGRARGRARGRPRDPNSDASGTEDSESRPGSVWSLASSSIAHSFTTATQPRSASPVGTLSRQDSNSSAGYLPVTRGDDPSYERDDYQRSRVDNANGASIPPPLELPVQPPSYPSYSTQAPPGFQSYPSQPPPGLPPRLPPHPSLTIFHKDDDGLSSFVSGVSSSFMDSSVRSNPSSRRSSDESLSLSVYDQSEGAATSFARGQWTTTSTGPREATSSWRGQESTMSWRDQEPSLTLSWRDEVSLAMNDERQSLGSQERLASSRTLDDQDWRRTKNDAEGRNLNRSSPSFGQQSRLPWNDKEDESRDDENVDDWRSNGSRGGGNAFIGYQRGAFRGHAFHTPSQSGSSQSVVESMGSDLSSSSRGLSQSRPAGAFGRGCIEPVATGSGDGFLAEMGGSSRPDWRTREPGMEWRKGPGRGDDMEDQKDDGGEDLWRVSL